MAIVGSLNADCVDERLHRSVAAHCKNQPGSVGNCSANARFHVHRTRGNHKFRRHLQLLERSAHVSQLPLGASRARRWIYEDRTLCRSEKLGRVAHDFDMLTNVAAAVNFGAASDARRRQSVTQEIVTAKKNSIKRYTAIQLIRLPRKPYRRGYYQRRVM